jgi:hypothetical protein
MSLALEVLVVFGAYSVGAFNGREAALKERAAPFNTAPFNASNGVGVGP